MSTTDRKAQLGISVDTTEAEKGFAKISTEAKHMADKVRQAGEEAKGGLDGMGKGADAPADKIDKATSKIVASIQRATAAAEAAGKSGSAYYESLANQRGANLEVLRPYLAQLDAVTKKQAEAQAAMLQGAASLDTVTMSAKATAAAMRGVPAQFTDIIVSLQGGQKPMTVLLQQGGQLKDMFGGVGNAASALTSYVAGLINPMTLLAAVAGTVGYAYYKGSQEADAYAKALILSGNAAGTTAGQLSSMAQSISKVTGTQSAAADALAQMAQSSKVGSDNLEAFTRSAMKFQSAGGDAVSEVVKQFAELAKSPTESSLKLTESMNYLTASLYRQIKALEDQGKTTEATALAQKTFADTLDTRAAQMVGQIGTIEAAWKGVWNVIKGAGDAMLNIGRVQSPAQQLAEVQAELRAARGQDKNRPVRMPWQPSESELMAEEARLQEMIRLERRGADAAAERAKQTAAAAEWDKTGIKYLADKVKMEQEITAARNIGLAAGESQVSIEQRIKAIRESYVKKGAGKEGDPFAADREYAKQYAKSWEDFTKIAAEAEGKTDNLSKAQEHLLEYLKSPAYSAHTAAMRETVLQSAYGAIAAENLAAEKKKEAAAMKEAAEATFANSDAIYKSMVSTEDKLRAQIQENDAIGKTSIQIAQLTKARDLEAVAALEAKATLYEQAGAREEDIDNIKRTAAALRQLADARVESAVKKQEQADWMSFFTSIDQAAHQVWSNVLQGGQDIWSKLRNTAKTIFFDWLYQMTLKKWIFSVGAAVSGNAAMAQSNTTPGFMDLAKLFKSAGSGWFSDFGGNLGGSIADFGTTMVDKGFTQLGTYVESFGLNVSSMSGTINTLGNGLGYLNSVIALSKGEWGKGIGSAIGTSFGGPIGSMIGSTIGSWIDRTFGGSTKPSIEGGYSTSGNPGTNGRAYTLGTDGMYYGGAIDSSAKSFVTGTATDYASIVRASGYTAGTLTGQAFIGYDGNGGSKGSQNKLDYTAFLNGQQIYSRYADLGTNNAGTGDQAMTDAAKEATTKAVLSALQATDLGPQLNKFLDSVKINGASLAEVTASLGDVTNYITFSNAVKNMPFDYLTNVSVEASKALIAAAGDIEKLGTNIGTYFELFGTQAEKQAYLTGNLSDGFKALGITLPKSTDGLREWYKAEVKRLGAMDLSIKANADAYNSILKLAGGVDAMANSADQAAAARQSWQDKIDLLNGTTTQAQLDMQRDLAGTTDETTKSIIRQYYAQKSAKDATDALTASLKAIEASRQSWQDQLDVLTGTATSEEIQMRKELAGTTDETTKSIIRQYYAEKARQKALAEATAAAATAMDNAKATFDRAINAERERLNALINQKQTVYDTVKGVFDLLASNVKDLYAQVASTAAMSASQGNAFITAALAMAKAGGVVPDQAQLSDAIKAVRDSIDTAQFTSQFEADRARLILAGQLSQLKDSTGDQLTVAERALATAKDQLSALERTAKYMQDMIDAAKGIDTSIVSVGDAVRLVNQSITAWTAAQTAAAKSPTLPTVSQTTAGGGGVTYGGGGAVFGGGASTETYTNPATTTASASQNLFLGLASGNGSAQAAADAYSPPQITINDPVVVGDVSAVDWQKVLSSGLGLASGNGIPSFAIGTNYVPRDTLANIHEGEAIIPKAFNPWAGTGAPQRDSNADVVCAISALESRLASIEANTQATAASTGVVAAAHDGQSMTPLRVEVIA